MLVFARRSRIRRSAGTPRTSLLVYGTLALSGLQAGCDQDDGTELPACVADLQVDDCELAYQPTWDNVFEQTLGPRCGVGEGSCHASADAAGAQGGLVLSDPEAAYDILLGEAGGMGFVEPGDPTCSPLVVRLEANDPVLRMPPDEEPLDARHRCSIEQWILQGAPP